MKNEPATTPRARAEIIKARRGPNQPAEVKRQSKAASKRLAKPGKAAKKPKPTAAQLKAARKLLVADHRCLAEIYELLKLGGCTGVLVAGRTPGGTDFISIDPMHRQTRAMARKAMREDAERQKQPEDLRDPGSRRIGA